MLDRNERFRYTWDQVFKHPWLNKKKTDQKEDKKKKKEQSSFSGKFLIDGKEIEIVAKFP